MKIQMHQCQTRLMIVWVTGCTALLLFVWIQIIFGHYGDKGRDVIEWLLPSIIPTLSLVVGVWANNAIKKSKSAEKVGKGIFQAVLIVSILYLLFIFMVFAIQPMIARPPLEVLKDSSLIVAPLQGVMCAFIGIFYTHEAKK